MGCPDVITLAIPDLTAAIRAFIDGYNQRCKPFAWTKTADQILTKPNRKRLQTRNISRSIPVFND